MEKDGIEVASSSDPQEASTLGNASEKRRSTRQTAVAAAAEKAVPSTQAKKKAEVPIEVEDETSDSVDSISVEEPPKKVNNINQ